MSLKSLTSIGGGLFAALLGASVLLAQETRPLQVPLPPPPNGDEDVVMYWNNPDADDGPEMEWFATGADAATAHGAHARRTNRMFIRGFNRPWLGVVLTDIDSAKAKELKLGSENGVLVKDVRENSPAAKAGVMKNDVIVEFAGEKVRSAAQLSRLVRETPVGRIVPLVVNRAGKTLTLNAQIETSHMGPMAMVEGGEPLRDFTIPVPPQPPEMGHNFNVFIARGARLGISGDDLTSQLAEFFGVKQGKGVLVREVTAGTPAEKAGLKAGDVIVAVDGNEVANVAELRHALAEGKTEGEKRKVSLGIVRDKHQQTLSVELDNSHKLMPKPVMRTEFEFNKEGIREIADQLAAEARELGEAIRAQAQSKEWQKQLQDEVNRLNEELPKLKEEIRKEVQGAMAELNQI